MEFRLLPLVGWASFLVGFVVQCDILAAHTAQQGLPLGGFQPHIDHSMFVTMSWSVVVLLVIAWLTAIESGNYYLLITMAVFIGKFGQEFSKTFLSWETPLWAWCFYVVLLGLLTAFIRQCLSNSRFILPRNWADASVRFHINSTP